MTLGEPEQLPAWVAVVVRLSVASLFMVSGIAAFMSIYGGTRRRVRKIFLPVAIIAMAAILIYPFRDLLPPLIEPVGLQALLADPTEFGILPGITWLSLVVARGGRHGPAGGRRPVPHHVGTRRAHERRLHGPGPRGPRRGRDPGRHLAQRLLQRGDHRRPHAARCLRRAGGRCHRGPAHRPAGPAVGLHGPRPHARQRCRARRPRGARPPRARDPRRPGAASLVRQAEVRAPRGHAVGRRPGPRRGGHAGARCSHRRGPRGARDDACQPHRGRALRRHAGAHDR